MPMGDFICQGFVFLPMLQPNPVLINDILPKWQIKGLSLLPIVQGGMGLGVSAHRLAGSVARCGAVGTISSVDLRRLHPDLMQQTHKSRDKALIDRVNLVALDREIKAALVLADTQGLVAVNIMRAISAYSAQVIQACQSGAQALVVGAGLPLELPQLTKDYPAVALIPILSDVRGISILVKRWIKKTRLPDAIVIEHPLYAGGHLGVTKPEQINDQRFDFAIVLEQALEFLKQMGLESEKIPLIPAGGINSHQQIKSLLSLGASAVQLGTAFAVTQEGDAHENFKQVLVNAKAEDIVTFMSVAGLPARAVKTPWLVKYLKNLDILKKRAKKRVDCTLAFDCLEHCGLRDGIAHFGQFCIDHHLQAAFKGDIEHGLFFRGASPLPFGHDIRTVRQLIDLLIFNLQPKNVNSQSLS